MHPILSLSAFQENHFIKENLRITFRNIPGRVVRNACGVGGGVTDVEKLQIQAKFFS